MKQTHFTPELWEQRFYEVAKDVLIEKLGTSSHSDSGRALDEEVEESIKVASKFIDKVKEVSEFRMGCGVWED